MSVLGSVIESKGIATTQISLIREHTEKMQPPRSLWVPFELGRPLGVPNDAAFQRRVIMAALDLLKEPTGPVLRDYPEDAPGPSGSEEMKGWACPVSFPAPPVDPDDLGAAVEREVAGLAPWYEVVLRHRGRTTVGVSGLNVQDAVNFLVGFLEKTPRNPVPDLPISRTFMLAIEDVKAYYLEAATAKPGSVSTRELYDWLWNETAFGRLMRELHEVGSKNEDAGLRFVANRSLVPRAQTRR